MDAIHRVYVGWEEEFLLPFFQQLLENQSFRHVPFLVKPLILLWLLNHDDGSVASSFMSMLLLTPHP
jgi:hypothetical protein